MNEQKPLSTADLAARSNEARGDVERDERAMADSRIESPAMSEPAAPAQGRDDMTSGFRNSGGMDPNTAPPALLPGEAAQAHREHWTDIQAHFIDDPGDAVEQADELVAEVIQIVATRFADQRKGLERQWQEKGEASTEDLRLAIQQYRSFFERLLAA